MRGNNWMEGEFQQVGEAWGLPARLVGPLLPGALRGLAGAVLAAGCMQWGCLELRAPHAWCRCPSGSVGSQQWLLVPLYRYGMGQPCCCCIETDGPSRCRAAHCWGAAQICAGGAVGCALSRCHHRPSPRAPCCIPQRWAARNGRLACVLCCYGHLLSLFSLLCNEPTLEDLERRSCRLPATYLPPSAPCSAVGINLLLVWGPSRCTAGSITRGVGRLLRGVGGWMVNAQCRD